MSPKNSIDVIIIAKNEAVRIDACMSSVSWADHIIVVDNKSMDATADIARQKGAIVVTDATDSFAQMRMLGASTAQAEWLFYVDADEIVTLDLQKEILEIVHGQAEFDAYFLPRKNYYMGFPWPHMDGMVRLMKKSSLSSWLGALHETADIRGRVGALHNFVIHHTHRDLEEMIEKTNQWSKTEATLRFEHKHPPVVWWRFLRVMITGFWGSFVLQGGWKASVVGWIESIYQAFSMFITYAKLWELQQNKSVKRKA